MRELEEMRSRVGPRRAMTTIKIESVATVRARGRAGSLGGLDDRSDDYDAADAVGRSWPSPHNFSDFLAWACHTYHVDVDLRVHKVKNVLTGEDSKASQSKRALRPSSTTTDVFGGTEMIHPTASSNADEGLPVLLLKAEYDVSGQLTHLSFLNNRKIPTGVMQVVNMIAQFHPKLHAVTIRRGLDAKGFGQLLKLQQEVTLTDVRLEDCRLGDACCDLLLEKPTAVKHLSLRRCGIDDSAVHLLAQRLHPPSLASKTLLVLDLASNRITANGGVHLAEMLRVNRTLCYLSVMGNALCDEGVVPLLDALAPFALRPSECAAVAMESLRFHARKLSLLRRTMDDVRAADMEQRRSVKRLSAERTSTPRDQRSRASARIRDGVAGGGDLAFGALYARAKAMVEHVLGPFKHPFSRECTAVEPEGLFCFGNEALQVLNVAYTEASGVSLRRLSWVLRAQARRGRSRLLNVHVQGWALPTTGPLAADAEARLKDADEQLLSRLLARMPPRLSMQRRHFPTPTTK